MLNKKRLKQIESKNITCPRCSRKFDTNMQILIDSEDDPKLVNSLISGEYWIRECPHCHNKFLFLHPTIFEETNTDTMIIYALGNDNILELEKDLILSRKFKNPHSVLRITDDIEQFKEKVQIASAGLDDRLIEAMKALWLTILKEKYINYNVSRSLCKIKSQNMLEITYISDGKADEYEFVCDIPITTYKKLANKAKYQLNKAYDLQSRVDTLTGLELLEEFEETGISVEAILDQMKKVKIDFKDTFTE